MSTIVHSKCLQMGTRKHQEITKWAIFASLGMALKLKRKSARPKPLENGLGFFPRGGSRTVKRDSKQSLRTPQVPLPEHTAMVQRLSSVISEFFRPTRVEVQEVDISEEVLARTVAEVLACPPTQPSSPTRNERTNHLTPQEQVSSEPEEEFALVGP
ncbi:MAG TPA: hypothetical protein VJU84_12530 [Pyrinomonadaceae bacterium]|nr:hypothetical protein [Pyrinomonadaceae bacterium]